MFILQRKRAAGTILLDGKEIGETLQCVHCGNHWQVLPSSGRKRGWCAICHGPTCGRTVCKLHIPFAAKLEYMEALSVSHETTIKKLVSRYPEIGKIAL